MNLAMEFSHRIDSATPHSTFVEVRKAKEKKVCRSMLKGGLQPHTYTKVSAYSF